MLYTVLAQSSCTDMYTGCVRRVNAALLTIVPKQLRALGMAMSILLMHLLGDLPYVLVPARTRWPAP